MKNHDVFFPHIQWSTVRQKVIVLFLIDYFQRGTTFSGKYYVKPIVNSLDDFKENRHRKFMKGVLFHQNNAPSRTSLKKKLDVISNGFWIVRAPDIFSVWVPSDNRLHKIEANKIMNDQIVISTINDISIVQTIFFENAVELLYHRWNKHVGIRGRYVKKFLIFSNKPFICSLEEKA